jgi:ATP-binding cassette, subfamily B, bacterial PglK
MAELQSIRRIWGLLRPPQRRGVFHLLLLMLLGMLLEILGVGLVIPAMALLAARDPAAQVPALRAVLAAFGNPSGELLAIVGVLLLVVVFTFKSMFLGLVAWRQVRFAHAVEADLAQRLFERYLTQPYSFHLQRNPAHLTNRAIIDVNLAADLGLNQALTLLADTIVLSGLAVFLVVIEPLGTVVVALAVGMPAWALYAVTRRSTTRWGSVRQVRAELEMQHLQQGLGAAKDVILLGREGEFLEHHRRHNSARLRAAERQAFVQRMPRLALELFVVMGLAALTLTMIAQGTDLDAVVPMLGMFAVAAFRISPSVARMLNALHMIQYAGPAIAAVSEDFTSLASPDRDSSRAGPAPPQKVELCAVTYSYPGAARQAVDDVSLTIRKGETIGIVGASGSGKTTLVDLLLGLLTPDSGEVRVDGVDIHTDVRAWQSVIGYVPQTIFLTDDTIRRNVAFGLGDEAIDEPAVRRAIAAAQLQELVAVLPAGLDTTLGDRGLRLSAGQRQRIGIARALYHDPSVLVLDEATASLDTRTEADVMGAIRALRGYKTIVIVAHRTSTVEQCDRVYQLNQGRMVAFGTPDEVLATRR